MASPPVVEQHDPVGLALRHLQAAPQRLVALHRHVLGQEPGEPLPEPGVGALDEHARAVQPQARGVELQRLRRHLPDALRREGLLEVVARAQLDRRGDGGGGRARGHEHHLHRHPGVADDPEHPRPVEDRHVQVEEHEVEGGAAELRERGGAVVRLLDLEAVGIERGLDGLPHGAAVVDDEDPAHARGAMIAAGRRGLY
jgi:hypothetical protein